MIDTYQDEDVSDGTDLAELAAPNPTGQHETRRPSGLDAACDDETALVMGHDGDDVGRTAKVKLRVDGNGDQDRMLAQIATGDMLDSSHGYIVRDLGTAPKTVWRTDCEVCGDPLGRPSEATEWFCQFGNEDRPASTTCVCNWCLHYQMWLRGEYRPNGGRPRQRCGTADCKRKAATQRKRRQRGRERAGQTK